MTDRTHDPAARPADAFDRADGFSGQADHRNDEAAEGRRATPLASVTGSSAEPGLPPEAGRRPAIDPVTGEVHGAGSGAGGGNAGEDHDDDRGGSDLPVARGVPSSRGTG